MQKPDRSASLLSAGDWERIGTEFGLAPRELELVQYIFGGQKLEVIAEEMRLSLGTVKTYNQRVYKKMRIHDQRQLVLEIFKNHLQTRGH